MKLSVLMPIYAKASAVLLGHALESIAQQSWPADEVVIVKDGPVPVDLEAVLQSFSHRLPIVSLPLPAQVGLGTALAAGVEACTGELIARMDADDLCLPSRFHLQVSAFVDDPSLDALGTAIFEFSTSPDDTDGCRNAPVSSECIRQYARSRNPFNHMTTMFRREAVLSAGNYKPFPHFEDYHLWVRMLLAGKRLANLQQPLVHVRAGDTMLERRSGWVYASTELAFQRFLCASGFISPAKALGNALLRLPVRLAPAPLRKLVYNRVLRSALPSPVILEVLH